MAQPLEAMNGGGMERYRPGDIGSFRTVTDGPAPMRARVRALPKEPPKYFHEAVKDAETVHLIGPGQADQAKAITYGVYPEVAAGRPVWTADLTGHRVTDDLASHAFRSGIGTLHWPDISPTRLVESHREIDKAQAAKLIVDSMPPGSKTDPELNMTRTIHLTRIFERMDEEQVPLLGGGYNALGAVLRSDQRDKRFLPDRALDDAMRKMYASEHARSVAQEVLGPVHIHMEALLREDKLSKPTRAHDDKPRTLFNFGVQDRGMFVTARRRLLAAHIDLRVSEDEESVRAEPDDVRPQEVVMAGTELVDPDPLLHIQTQNEQHGAKTVYVFGDVNDTTTEVIGTDRALTGSLGGLNGPKAEQVSDAVGKHWQKAVTSRSTHSGDSNTVGGGKGGATVSGSQDETTTYEARHTISTDAVQHVEPDSVTLVQGKVVHKNIPFVPRAVSRSESSVRSVPRQAQASIPVRRTVRALPATESWTTRTVRRLGFGGSSRQTEN